jgi:hypothetical protein
MHFHMQRQGYRQLKRIAKMDNEIRHENKSLIFQVSVWTTPCSPARHPKIMDLIICYWPCHRQGLELGQVSFSKNFPC